MCKLAPRPRARKLPIEAVAEAEPLQSCKVAKFEPRTLKNFEEATMSGTWSEWQLAGMLVAWVCGLRLEFHKEFIGDVESGSKTETRRLWKYSHLKKFWLAHRKHQWVRAMRGRRADSQFGWLYITSMHFEQICSMPASAPSREGRPEMSVKQFTQTYFANGSPKCLPRCECSPSHGDVCDSCSTYVIVIRFIFAPIGDHGSPFPCDIR